VVIRDNGHRTGNTFMFMVVVTMRSGMCKAIALQAKEERNKRPN